MVILKCHLSSVGSIYFHSSFCTMTMYYLVSICLIHRQRFVLSTGQTARKRNNVYTHWFSPSRSQATNTSLTQSLTHSLIHSITHSFKSLDHSITKLLIDQASKQASKQTSQQAIIPVQKMTRRTKKAIDVLTICCKRKKKKLDKPYKRLQSPGEDHVKMAYRCSKFNAYCLFRCREHAALIFCCICRHTVTLHQGQDHQTEHIRHRHAKFECNSLHSCVHASTRMITYAR